MTNGPREKRRNSEKRKEKSRDAARCRRGRETEIFYQLSNQLPLSHSISSKLDKATTMRLAISFLKIHRIMGKDRQQEEAIVKERLDQLYPKAMEGFVVIISRDGDFVYVSEQVAKYLGIQQMELMGQSLFDFSHPCDHDEVRDILSTKFHNSKDVGLERTFFVRMKCTLTNKGRNINLKSANYKVIKYTGKLEEMEHPLIDGSGDKDGVENFVYLLAIGEPIPHPSNIEFPLDSQTFLTRHSMDMKFTFCDDRIKDLIGYNSEELMGKSVYNYHHALDSEVVEKAYKDLFAKGQSMTGQYRFLAKHGGYVQMLSQATIISNNRTQKPQCVVCVHFVLSNVEKGKVVLSDVQQTIDIDELLTPFIQMSTEKIFAPKTKEMDNSFYIPQEIRDDLNADGNNPDDLTHLAPTAGDVCIPLSFPEDADFVEIKSSVGLDELFQPDEPVEEDPPFASFKEEPKEQYSRRQETQLSSPIHSSQASSPYTEVNSPADYVKLPSPGMVEPELLSQKFSAMDTSQTEILDDEDMDMRAPYIPMNLEDDFGLFTPTTESLFSLPCDFNPGLFGKTESVFVPKSVLEDNSNLPPPMLSVRDLLARENATNMNHPVRFVPPTQAKRPLEVSCLEKGPPVKVAKLDSGQIDKTGVGPKDKSVLMNLLLTGEDRNHGYSVRNSLIRRVSNAGDEEESEDKAQCQSCAVLLPSITQQDCEVNAPTNSRSLLQGEDLMRALDGCPPTPSMPSGLASLG